jgi:hypothetical protein
MSYLRGCDHCGGPARFAAEIQPLGRQPGHRVFECVSCNRHTWATWQPDEENDPSSMSAQYWADGRSVGRGQR